MSNGLVMFIVFCTKFGRRKNTPRTVQSKRKTLRHEYFEKHYNGPEDWDKVLNNPTNDVNKEEWKQICQLFTSPQFIARSVKNKENRKKEEYSTTQGTKSLAAIRFEKTNPDLIESWKDYHWKKATNDFVNDDARQDYEKLKADFELQTQQTSTDASNNDSPSSVDQVEVLQKVLGQRRGHERGVTRKLKGSGSGSGSRSGSGSSSTQHSHFSESQVPPHHSREYIEKLENNLQKLTDQVNFLSQFFVPSFRPPNVQMPPVPDSDNISRASSSQPQLQLILPCTGQRRLNIWYLHICMEQHLIRGRFQCPPSRRIPTCMELDRPHYLPNILGRCCHRSNHNHSHRNNHNKKTIGRRTRQLI
ncbi:uncharacterized protein LOC133789703 [Humulus lupulus]|uniref:uncharacterized protein LOC133789703 n=1 Tax=Humulus lupulus TaxID=3486 RepID=UPI002B418639|nr:uncharacterized protein LOC133789703 [Humulus lupulus]